jgi:hypothetical protein
MTPEKLALINLIARLGIDTAVVVWKNIHSAATIDDAIAALEKSMSKNWTDFKNEPGT